MTVVDYRSDFLARPTPAMVDAMAAAARLQPDFDLRTDPTVAALERRAAEILGTEDSLFCPTCTQANQIAIHLRCRPGESVIAESAGHIFTSEAGAPAALSGALAVRVPGARGVIDPADLRRAIARGDSARSRTALIVLENTHVFSGGGVVPVAAMRALAEVAREHRLPVHIDGARIFNAAVALRRPPAELAACGDSIAVSLNKGLAAPMGAILAGGRDFIGEAVRVRHMFGGAWRPAHIVAAAGLVALETMIERLAEDHANARRLADGLVRCRGVTIDPVQVQSNIVLAAIDEKVVSVATLVARLAERGVLVMPITWGAANVLRFVTHHDIGRDDVDRTVAALEAIARAG